MATTIFILKTLLSIIFTKRIFLYLSNLSVDLSSSLIEKLLVQDLINEQLKIYGVEVIYIPRKFVRRETIIEEVSSSVFDDNFAIDFASSD